MASTKTALITGASGGIGLEFARAMAKDGYALTLIARSGKKLQEIAKSIGGEAHKVVEADLSVPADIERVAKLVSGGGFDVLVNNAGVGVYGRFEALPLDKQQAMMRLNMDALVTLSHAYLAGAKKGDALVNVASTLGLLAFPTASVYAATKAFVVNFSESLWHEQRTRGVYVMALCPGVTKTNFHEAAGGNEENRPPERISESPESVVGHALSALKARKRPSVVSGTPNKLMLTVTRLLPRKAMVNMMGSFGNRN